MTLRNERNQVLKAVKGKAYRIEVELPHNITEYALNFLKIYNNARVDRRILKLYNTSMNNIYVVVKETAKDDAVDWLECFGEIKEVMEVKTITPIIPDTCVDRDFDEYAWEVEWLDADYE